MTGAKGPEFLLESDGFRQYVVTSPDDRLVATGFNESEGPITLWDLQAQKKLGIFETKSTIASMSFSARGDRLVTLNSSGRITVWDTGNFKKVGEQVIKDFINGAPCFINTQGTQVLVLSGGRAVDLWDLTTNQKTLIRGSFWSPHIGRYANIKRLSSQGELSIEIFDFDNPSTPLAILPIGKTVINAIHFSYDGTQLAVSTQDRITQIFKLPKPPEAL
jgi:WD40 repeat protein